MICYFMLSFGCQFCYSIFFFFFKQKTAYEMRISDWSSDVCSSDLPRPARPSRSASLIGVAAPAMRERARHGGDHVERGEDDADADRLVGPALRARDQIGRASCRESVCQYVEISGVAVSLQKKQHKRTNTKNIKYHIKNTIKT